MSTESKQGFFVSYNRYDRTWAEWIAWILKAAGYSVVIQAWDFRPGGNFVLEMQRAASQAERTIAVLSENYLKSEFTQPEWAAAFAQDPTGEKRSLIPIRVGACTLTGMLATIIYVDLVEVDEATAQERVLNAVQTERPKPSQKPTFPTQTAVPSPDHSKPTYPQTSKVQNNSGQATGWQIEVKGGTAYIGETLTIGSDRTSASSPALTKRILILAANPRDTARRRLDQEVREIEQGLRLSKHRDFLKLEQQWAVRPRELRRAMLEVQPRFVHFCGQGNEAIGIVLEDDFGNAKEVTPEALAGLFALFAGQVECVLLNACYSEIQASAIAQHIPFVIGMTGAIAEEAATEFAVAFYDAIADRRTVEFAYQLGCNAIQMAGVSGHLIPVLKQKS